MRLSILGLRAVILGVSAIGCGGVLVANDVERAAAYQAALQLASCGHAALRSEMNKLMEDRKRAAATGALLAGTLADDFFESERALIELDENIRSLWTDNLELCPAYTKYQDAAAQVKDEYRGWYASLLIPSKEEMFIALGVHTKQLGRVSRADLLHYLRGIKQWSSLPGRRGEAATRIDELVQEKIVDEEEAYA